MSEGSYVMCCLPDYIYKLICETLRLDGQSKSFDLELRQSVGEAAEMVLNSGRYIPGFNFPERLLPDGVLNDMLTLHFLNLLSGVVTPQLLDWNWEAIAEVKSVAVEVLKKFYSIDIPSDQPKDILIRRAKSVNDEIELMQLGFIYENQLHDGGWDVPENIKVWVHPYGLRILTINPEGKFGFIGEKNSTVIREIVNHDRLGRFLIDGDFILPEKLDIDSDGIMGFVYESLGFKGIEELLKLHPNSHVYTLISTKNGQKIVPGALISGSVGHIMTRKYVFIDDGIEIPSSDTESSVQRIKFGRMSIGILAN
jgi:hypothetical protein